MFDDRRANIESVQQLGEEVLEQAADGEKEHVKDQLEDLTTRWEALLKDAEERQVGR